VTSLLLSLIVPAMLAVVVSLQRDPEADPLAQAVSIGAFAAGNVAFASSIWMLRAVPKRLSVAEIVLFPVGYVVTLALAVAVILTQKTAIERPLEPLMHIYVWAQPTLFLPLAVVQSAILATFQAISSRRA